MLRKHFLTAGVVVAIAIAATSISWIEKNALAQDKAIGGQPPTPEQLLGAWVLVGAVGEAEQSEPSTRIKFFGLRHWTVTDTTQAVAYSHGGTYTLDGGKYAEKVAYASEATANLVGNEFKFTLRIDGDRLTQLGDGNPWNEVWKRAK